MRRALSAPNGDTATEGRGRSPKRLKAVVTLAGFVVGVAVASVFAALLSSQCAGMSRSLTVLPPGLRCFGPKDGVRYIPWSPSDSSPLGLLPVVVLGGGFGALFFGLTFHLLSRRGHK